MSSMNRFQTSGFKALCFDISVSTLALKILVKASAILVPSSRRSVCNTCRLQTCRLQTCRLADLQTRRPADLQTCRLADLQTCRLNILTFPNSFLD